MAKRIYTETVKKYWKKAGLTGGTLIGLIFMYLFAIGAISNVSYSDDMVCAGTIEDPCYAFINFTAEEDIFIYPVNYDPWGRNTPFDFDPNVKSWKLERSWGSGWREIPLNETCQYTWCGAPENNMEDNKYSYAFREDRDYQLRITAYKNNPFDNIKWGAFSGVDRIDPVWEGIQAQIEGSKVFVNDSNAYISAEPHTLKSSDYVEFDIKSKTYTGDINVIWGFNTSNTIPRSAALYNPTNETWNTTHTKTVYNVTNNAPTELPCDYGNEYNNIHQEVSYLGLNGTNETTEVFCFDSYTQSSNDYNLTWETKHWEYTEWQDISGELGKINRDLNGKDTWYYASNVPIEANQTYKVRAYMEVIPGTQGKYDFAGYPSSYGENVISAYNDGNLYLLDPWWNSSFTYKRNITNSSSNLLLPLNCSGGTSCTSDIDGDGNNEVLYGVPSGSSASVYYNNDTDAVTANNTTETCIIDTLNNRSSCPNPPEGLVAHYALDRSSGDVKDYIGGNDGTNNGATRGVTGKINNSFSFTDQTDGSEEDVTLSSNRLGVGDSQKTYTGWIKIASNTTGGNAYLFGNANETTGSGPDPDKDHWSSFINPTDDTVGVTGNLNGIGFGDIISHSLNYGEFYFLGIVLDDSNPSGNKIEVYLNGINIGNVSDVVPPENMYTKLNVKWHSSQGYWLTQENSIIDEVQIYDRALSSSEVSTLYEKSNHVSLDAEETESAGNSAPSSPTLNAPTDDASGQSLNPLLNVTITDSDGDAMNVTFINNSDHTTICNNNTNIENGSDVLCTWSGLSELTDYQWYVNVTDGTSTTTSDTWNFTTEETIDTSIERIYPNLVDNNYNATQNEFFNVTLNVTCLSGSCGTVNVSLDPIVILETPDTEILNDYDNYRGGASHNLTVATQNLDDIVGVYPTLMMFNISGIPEGQQIDNATLYLNIYDQSFYDYGCYEYTNRSWNEEDGTTDNESVGAILDTFYAGSTGWKKCDITSWINSDYVNLYPNSSIFFKSEADVTEDTHFYSKEHSNTSLRPYLNITYSEVSSTTKSGLIPIESDFTNGTDAFYTNASSNPLTTSSLSSGQSETVTFYVNATGDLDTYEFFAFANVTSNMSISNETSHWNVTIVEEVISENCWKEEPGKLIIPPGCKYYTNVREGIVPT